MIRINQLTRQQARHFFDYTDGQLVWKNPSRSCFIGKQAGCSGTHRNGYRRIYINRVSYGTHVLVWNWHFGLIPESLVLDHVTGLSEGGTDHIGNLRVTTDAANVQKKAMTSRNTSGFRGVHYCHEQRRWKANIYVEGRNLNLGRFDAKEDAALAYDEAAIFHFGMNARPNFNQLICDKALRQDAGQQHTTYAIRAALFDEFGKLEITDIPAIHKAINRINTDIKLTK